ncbi:TraB/GumN family protein [Pontiellaceae bacterium B1224]|nr:TraB/GumN family protein [Pontiellaceae bacterium B1224]
MLNKRRALKTAVFALSATILIPATLAKSMLWKVSSQKGTLYIQGSAHVLKAENYPLAPAIQQAYSDSSALILEADMGEMMSPQTQQLILKKAMLQKPETLKTLLKPQTYENLTAIADETGLPMPMLDPFKPWFATTTITLLKLKKLGMDEQYGLDKYFYGKATADQKKIIGLESIDFQISLFDSLSNENPDDFVNRALADLKFLEADLDSLLKAWETGDVQTLEKLMTKSFKKFPGMYNKFITARNKAWAKRLSGMVKNDQTYMVVVGAGHLPGKEGVINLLKEKGFTVEQL